MTGAPKKRSVELLQSLEMSERGLYSGVGGYFDVGGCGVFAVIIRSCTSFQPSSHPEDLQSEEWEIGAGGAITALSDSESEWFEMLTKLPIYMACE